MQREQGAARAGRSACRARAACAVPAGSAGAHLQAHQAALVPHVHGAVVGPAEQPPAAHSQRAHGVRVALQAADEVQRGQVPHLRAWTPSKGGEGGAWRRLSACVAAPVRAHRRTPRDVRHVGPKHSDTNTARGPNTARGSHAATHIQQGARMQQPLPPPAPSAPPTLMV